MNQDFMVAFALDHFSMGVRNDPRYFKFVQIFSHGLNGHVKRTYYPVHRCKEEDYAKFYPVDSFSKVKVE